MSLTDSYDDWRTSTLDDKYKPSFPCEHCDNPIVIGEEYTKTSYGNVCDHCYDEFAWNILDASREVAEEEVDYGEND